MSRRCHELADAQWEKVKDLLPGKTSDPGRTAADNCLFVDAVLYVLKTGIPWSDLPERYGKLQRHPALRRFKETVMSFPASRKHQSPNNQIRTSSPRPGTIPATGFEPDG